MAIRKYLIASVALNSLRVRAFDPGKAGWKLAADGKTIEMKDGNPIRVDDNGNESVVQLDTISRFSQEAKTNRERAETAEGKLKAYGDLDPVAAKKAIDTVGKLDAKKLIDAGEVDRVKAEIQQQFQGQITELTNANNTLKEQTNKLRIDSVFAQSEFIRNEIAMPRDFFEAAFKQNFKVNEKGEVEAFDRSGNRIFSKKNSGDYAQPDEALAILVDSHPQKASILKAPDHSGSGNNGGGGGRNQGRSIKRAEFFQLPPAQQAAMAADASAGKLVIVD